MPPAISSHAGRSTGVSAIASAMPSAAASASTVPSATSRGAVGCMGRAAITSSL